MTAILVCLLGGSETARKHCKQFFTAKHNFRHLSLSPDGEIDDQENRSQIQTLAEGLSYGKDLCQFIQRQLLPVAKRPLHERYVMILGSESVDASDLNLLRKRPRILLVTLATLSASKASQMIGGTQSYLTEWIIYNQSDLTDLEFQIDRLASCVEVLIRPSWDLYFMRLAFMASSRSNCLKRRVGAVIVKDKRIMSTGYNGTPSQMINCYEGGCNRCLSDLEGGEGGEGRNLEACECLHAEANALLEVGRTRCDGADIYVTCCPCLGCAKMIIQVVGILF